MDRLPERIRSKLEHCEICGCWLYVGKWSSGNGYGKVWWKGAAAMMHRVVWEILRGPIPDTLVLDHKECRSRGCANPDHLEPVTVRINTLRGEAVLFTKESAMPDEAATQTEETEGLYELFELIRRLATDGRLTDRAFRILTRYVLDPAGLTEAELKAAVAEGRRVWPHVDEETTRLSGALDRNKKGVDD